MPQPITDPLDRRAADLEHARDQVATILAVAGIPDRDIPWWLKQAVKPHNDRSGVFGGKGEVNTVQLLAFLHAVIETTKKGALA